MMSIGLLSGVSVASIAAGSTTIKASFIQAPQTRIISNAIKILCVSYHHTVHILQIADQSLAKRRHWLLPPNRRSSQAPPNHRGTGIELSDILWLPVSNKYTAAQQQSRRGLNAQAYQRRGKTAFLLKFSVAFDPGAEEPGHG